jgi:methionyl-tRNA formyltransferase
MSARAVVFANHDVGVRCLRVLLAAGVDVPLVVTHRDESHEALAFASVSETARLHGLEVALPDDVNEAALADRVAALEPDFIFSFYCRQMIGARILDAARRGALNMHGSLLPAYRGRAPVNWAVIRSETSTGATLHYMTDKPDAGDIVDQEAVPILPDDTAFDVFTKIAVVAEIVLWRSLPALIAGSARRVPQDAARASYFGRRRPEDGRIAWGWSAKTIHDLVRGVAPPYPGAFAIVGARKLRLLRSAIEHGRAQRHAAPALYVDDGACYVDCGGGGVLRVIEADVDGAPVAAAALGSALGFERVLALRAESEVAE